MQERDRFYKELRSAGGANDNATSKEPSQITFNGPVTIIISDCQEKKGRPLSQHLERVVINAIRDSHFNRDVIPCSRGRYRGSGTGKPHPLELRCRVVDFVDEGHSHREAARHFRVSPRFVNDLIVLRRETGSLAPKR